MTHRHIALSGRWFHVFTNKEVQMTSRLHVTMEIAMGPCFSDGPESPVPEQHINTPTRAPLLDWPADLFQMAATNVERSFLSCWAPLNQRTPSPKGLARCH
jgi:hypothetical protein